MASTNDFVALLENPDFKLLVAQIFTVVAKSQENGITANVACDALQYVNALVYKASPHNEGPKGLREAHKQMAADSKAMLEYIREASLRRGKPLLFSMTKPPTIN